MIRPKCVNFAWEWIIDLESTKVFSKTEKGAKSSFWTMDICDIEIEDCEQTGEFVCKEFTTDKDGECPSDCSRYKEDSLNCGVYHKTSLTQEFVLTSLCRADVQSVLPDELKPLAYLITDDQMRHLADKISENCVGYGSYWQLCEELGERYIRENVECGECGEIPCVCEEEEQ